MEIDISQIRALRKRLDITQKELSKAAGVSQSLIAKIESGKIDPAFTKVKKITEALLAMQEKSSPKAADIMSRRIIALGPEESIKSAVRKMNVYGISQLPVLSRKSCIGLVTEAGLLSSKKKLKRVRDAMQECPPIVPPNTPISKLTELIEYYPLILVSEKGEPKGVITKTDIIRGLYSGQRKP